MDAATFGLDDHVAAGVRAAGDWFHGDDIGAAYRQRMAEQHASDAYDKAHYGIARTTGTVGSLFLPGGGVGVLARLAGRAPQVARLGAKTIQTLERLSAPAAKVARRIPEVTRLSGREKVAMAGVGAAGGVGGQFAVDLTQGRPSSWRDYVGAAVGGSAEAVAALKGNPRLAAALGGATSSAAQDVLNGRAPSIDEAAKSAYASSVLASLAGSLAANRAARSSIKQKEQLGELGSQLRTLLNGDWTVSTEKRAYYLDPANQIVTNGRRVKRPYTLPDQRTARNKLVESKFGEWAELSPRQIQAYRELGSKYRVDHFLPQDAGSVAGFLISQPTHAASNRKDWETDPATLRPLRPVDDPARFGPGFPAYFR